MFLQCMNAQPCRRMRMRGEWHDDREWTEDQRNASSPPMPSVASRIPPTVGPALHAGTVFAGEARVRTRHSAISRGTELLVHRGGVPAEIASRMRAPFQDGELPGPVKYGYLSVGVVEEGPKDLLGRDVFCLFPHQDRYVVPVTALTTVPSGVPARRATLAGAAETAVNALWDAAPRLGDRVAVVGAGMIGCTVARLLRTFPLDRLELVDVEPGRAAVGEALGVEVVHPADAAGGCDVVVHASATS